MEWTTIITAAITGSITGAIASLIAPWVHWTIEKRRNQSERRRKLIDCWQAMLARHVSTSPGAKLYRIDTLFSDPAYSQLRPHLPADILGRLEAQRQLVVAPDVAGIAGNPYLAPLAQEIHRLEEEWFG
jgi:hypothetical protein